MLAQAWRVAAVAVAGLVVLPACAESGGGAGPATVPASTVVRTTVEAPATEPATTEPASTMAPPTVAPATVAPATTVPPGPTALPAPGATRVLVLNAGFKDGGAGATADGLRAIGYQVLTPQNALTDLDRSAVHFREGWEPAAREVARRAGIADELVSPLPGGPLTDPEPAGFDVVVLLGRDRR